MDPRVDPVTAAENIAAWRATASAEDIDRGRDWYPMARSVARQLAARYGVGIDTAAGVIAALSPRCSWSANMAAAEAVLREHADGVTLPPLPGVYGGNIRKARNIAAAGDNYPRCNGTRVGKRGGLVQCAGRAHSGPAADYLHGPKVTEFAATIGGKRDGRVVDVWATRAADVHPADVLHLAADDPRRTGDPAGRIAQLQDAYAEVAAEYGEDPRVTQAIVWTRIRRVWTRSDGRRNGIHRNDDIPF